MLTFARASLSRKLTIITMLATGAALFIVFGVLSVSEVMSRKAEQWRQLSSLADVTALNSRAAIVFDDQKAAVETLSALSANDEVLAAALYRPDGKLFARYAAPRRVRFDDPQDRWGESPATQAMSVAGDDGRGWWATRVSLRRPVLQQGENFGTVLIEADLSGMWSGILARLGIFGAAAVVSFCIAIILAGRFKKFIAEPVTRLVDAAQKISQTRDYTLRVDKIGDDELGILIDGFNEMLAQIESRDAQLERSKDHLEQQVSVRTSELEKAKDAAEAASRAKTEFLAAMSHEIRTPMNGVLGMTEILLATSTEERHRRLAQSIKQSGAHLVGLINNILDFSKIEASRLELETLRFDLVELLEDTTCVFAQQAQAKRIELLCDIPPGCPHHVLGDPGRLRQVLTNLIGNALKFTHHGEVIVRVAVAEDTQLIRFEVKDTGIGVPESSQARIFDSFTQADGSTTRKYGGTGLGLAICKRLVRMMGGAIGVDSSAGHGATFWFTVRLKKAGAAAAEPAPLRGLRVLVVESNASGRAILEGQLQGWGAAASSVAYGRELVRAAREAAQAGAPFEVVMLDAELEDADGTAVLQAIEREPALEAARLVLLSPIAKAGADIRGGRMTWSLAKPVRQAELLKCLALAAAGQPDAADSLARARSADPASSQVAAKPLAGRRVLLAEDNRVNQEVAIEMLTLLGADTRLAVDGLEAVESLEQLRCDLVLMDCQMPKMDGYEATVSIRRREQERGLPRVPIIALTANAVIGDREACIAAGMDDYLSKPFSLSDLLEAVARWLPGVTAGPPPVSQATPSKQQPAREPINRNTLDSMRRLQSQSGSNLMMRVVSAYMDDAPRRLKALQDAVEAGDARGLQKSAHAWKSSSMNVGADQLAALLKKLEQAGREGSCAGAAELVAAAAAEFDRVTLALSGETRAGASREH
ncbi:MAG: response regulator [Nevskia sp.]|nr:response regulator [Nevskia sp.]